MLDEEKKQTPIQPNKKAYAADLSGASNYSHVFTNRNRIWDMRCIGMTWDEIAQYLNMNTPTLRKMSNGFEKFPVKSVEKFPVKVCGYWLSTAFFRCLNR